MTQVILMPELGAEEVRLTRWLKEIGDRIEIGDVVAEAETDKTTFEIEAEHAGTLLAITVPAPAEGVKAGQEIARVGKAAAAVPDMPAKAVDPVPVKPADPAPERRVPAASINGTETPRSRIFASPLARRLAAELGVDLSQVKGTGPKYRILADDVRAASSSASSGQAKPQAGASIAATRPAAEPVAGKQERIELTAMRRVAAERLQQSKATIPHFYLARDIELSGLLELRQRLNRELSAVEGASRVSINDMLVKAVATALRRRPDLNVSFAGDHIVRYEDIDISFAVATPDGLITPVIRQADRKSLLTISSEIRELTRLARDGKLRPDQYQGGTFSVSNLGMHGVEEFAAILNPPQAAILSIGSVQRQPAFGENDEIVARNVARCTLSLDHRAIDGATGASFLAELQTLAASPLLASL